MGLVVSVRQLSETIASSFFFYSPGESWRHSSDCFLIPTFCLSIPSILPNIDSLCLIFCDL